MITIRQLFQKNIQKNALPTILKLKDKKKILMNNGPDYDLDVCDTKIYNNFNHTNNKLFEKNI